MHAMKRAGFVLILLFIFVFVLVYIRLRLYVSWLVVITESCG